MANIKKRNGNIVPYDVSKIEAAVAKAFTATEETPPPLITPNSQIVSCKVQVELIKKYGTEEFTTSVEEVQDIVEKTLMQNFPATAKAYILYRKNHQNVRESESALLDVKKSIEGYIGENKDWRVKENSTVTCTLGGLILSNSGAMTSNYWLNEIYDPEIAEAHKNADIHIHDLSMLSGYCAGWSLKQLIMEGLGGVEGRISSAPAKHLSTLCNQMVNFLGIMQNEWAGAQAFSSFDTYLAPFVKNDNLTYKETKQCIQSFIYGVNTPSRWGCVDTDTEVLSVDGFKKYNELKEGDLIYTWNDGRLELNPVRKVIQKPFKGQLHSYQTDGYNQTVTPNHRMLIKKTGTTEFVIEHSEDVFIYDSFTVPTKFNIGSINDRNLSDTEVINIAKEYAMMDENSEQPLNVKFLSLNEEQAKSFIGTWCETSGFTREQNKYCQYHTDNMKDVLQHIAILASHCSYSCIIDGKKYVVVYADIEKRPSSRVLVNYDGIVWCPNVENGTAVFRKDGTVYISGQTQAPFTNVTIDWTCPEDMKNMPALIGGKEMDFTYGDCKCEMDMINKAFIEIMIEGDYNGRGFQYPMNNLVA